YYAGRLRQQTRGKLHFMMTKKARPVRSGTSASDGPEPSLTDSDQFPGTCSGENENRFGSSGSTLTLTQSESTSPNTSARVKFMIRAPEAGAGTLTATQGFKSWSEKPDAPPLQPG